MSPRTRGWVVPSSPCWLKPKSSMHEEIGLGVAPGRGRDRQRVRRRTEHGVDDVELEAGGAAADKTEIAEHLVIVDALERPAHALDRGCPACG